MTSLLPCPHSHHRDGQFSVRGLEICLDYFVAIGFNAKVVVPHFRVMPPNACLTMSALQKRGLLITTGDATGKFSATYEYRFILDIAHKSSAAVVSNDNYRDLLPGWKYNKQIVEVRVIKYAWLWDKLFLGHDPYGRKGPTLDQIQ